MMGSERDEVILSDWERERLAAIEGHLTTSDPGLTRRLTGRRPHLTLLVATALVILGGAVAVAMFTRWLWLAATGLAVMAAGIFLGVDPVVARLKRYRQVHQPASPRD
jgi:lysylphosphatidylglycerol synthetase-like protein (DUF2156 family)